jgi:hypothetical protein
MSIVTQRTYFVTWPHQKLTAHQEGAIALVNDLLVQDRSKPMRRLAVAALSGQGLSPYQVADQLGYSPRHGYTLRQHLETSGLAGMFDQPRPGRPPKAKPEAQLEVEVGPEPGPQVVGRTRWGGLWLLWPLLWLSSWWAVALTGLSFSQPHQVTVQTWLLTWIAALSCGFRRLSHLNGVDDVGLALFTGRQRVMDQSLAHRLLPQVQGTAQLIEATTDRMALARDKVTATPHLALDEHVAPRWSSLADLPKTKVTTRGKVMRAEKLVYLYDLVGQRVVTLVSGALAFTEQLTKLIPEAHRRWGRVRLFFDKGGYQGALFGLICRLPGVTFVTPAKNYASNVWQWLYLPAEEYRAFIWRGQPVFLAEMPTSVKDCPVPLRALVLRKLEGKPLTARFEAFFTNDWHTSAEDIFTQYGLHWRQETSYRVLVHDLALDALPKGYHLTPQAQVILDSDRVRFIGWLKGMIYNLFRDFGQAVGDKWTTAQVGTLIRTFIHRPACLVRQGPVFRVELDYFRDAVYLHDYIRNLNAQQLALPMLAGLILQVVVLPPQPTPHVRLFSGPEG